MRLFHTLIAIAAAVAATTAGAAITLNTNVTNDVIFGNGGNANGGFNVDRSNNIELGLRAKVRYNASNQPQNIFNNNNDGTYTHAAGNPSATDPNGPGFRARWNFEWSVNSDQASTGTAGRRNLTAFTYELGIDTNAGVGTTYTVIDLLGDGYFDHSFGDNSTTAATNSTNGGAEAPFGDTAAMLTLAANNNLMQNSWNMSFFDDGLLFAGNFDPTVNGNYSFYLRALDQAGAEQSRVDITVIVGTGAVPEPGSLALAGLALLGAFAARRRVR